MVARAATRLPPLVRSARASELQSTSTPGLPPTGRRLFVGGSLRLFRRDALSWPSHSLPSEAPSVGRVRSCAAPGPLRSRGCQGARWVRRGCPAKQSSADALRTLGACGGTLARLSGLEGQAPGAAAQPATMEIALTAAMTIAMPSHCWARRRSPRRRTPERAPKTANCAARTLATATGPRWAAR